MGHLLEGTAADGDSIKGFKYNLRFSSHQVYCQVQTNFKKAKKKS